MNKNDLNYFLHESSFVDKNTSIGEGTKISAIGNNCSLGQNVNIGNNVIIGDNVKIQNNVSIYEGVELEEFVFCGPSMVFTNIKIPRSEFPQGGTESYQKTLVKKSASIGANATIVCGVTIGRYAFIGAGAVVRSDVPDYALMLGVPARQHGWMSRHGHVLHFDESSIAACPESKLRYELSDGKVRGLDLSEDEPLPEKLSRGGISYHDLKPGQS